MNYRILIGNAWYQIFGQHFFSTIERMPNRIASTISNFNYRSRIWEQYPLTKTSDGRELLFLHAPKTAGTSVAHSMGFEHIRHMPAYVFRYSDPDRFGKALTFSIIREPIDRLASMIRHINTRKFDLKMARKLGLEDTQRSCSQFLHSKRFRHRLFGTTSAGACGFPVLQSTYVVHDDRLIVDALFSFDRLDTLQEWLSDALSKPIQLPHANSTDRSLSFVPSADDVAAARVIFKRDFELWDMVRENGIWTSSQ